MNTLDRLFRQYIDTALWSSCDDGDKLTDIADSFGASDLYVGDDGLLYVYPA